MLAALFTLRCGPLSGGRDYYAEVIGACDYKPKAEWLLPVGEYDVRPACKSAFLKVLPFNDTWKKAPPGYQDAILSAYHALLVLPLTAPPKNAIFGIQRVSPQGAYRAGMIPEDFWALFQEGGNPNRAIFNYAASKADAIEYEEATADNESFAANYSAVSDSPRAFGQRVMTFYEGYYRPERDLRHTNTRYIRAAVLLHEARHGDGFLHLHCDPAYPPGAPNGGTPECDSDLTGPHGLEYTYLYFLLQGAIQQGARTGKMDLTQREVALLGGFMCSMIADPFTPAPVGFAETFDPDRCWSTMTYRRVMELEGLQPLPPDGSPISGTQMPGDALK